MIKPAIRAAAPDDVPALLSLIYAHADFEQGTASIKADGLARLVVDHGSPVILHVAEYRDELVGFSALTVDYSLWRDERWGHVDCLFVALGARGNGFGARLLASMALAARRLGCARLEWQTPDWNDRAAAFYRREGAGEQRKRRFVMRLSGDLSAPASAME